MMAASLVRVSLLFVFKEEQVDLSVTGLELAETIGGRVVLRVGNTPWW